MSILDVIDELNYKLECAINDLPKVRADKIGLDSRAGAVYVDVDNDLIITGHHNVRSLEYYGGFEYIDDEATMSVGEFKIYGIEQNDRVEDALEFYKQHTAAEDEEE